MIRPLHNRILTLAAAAALLCPTAAVLAGPVNILSQHYDNNRSGANLSETTLTPSVVSGSTFGHLYDYSVNADVYAQPLYYANLSIGGGTHNVLFVATMNDTVYAFDADTNSTYWSNTYVPSGEAPPTIDQIDGLTTSNIVGNVGIEGTPVIDGSSNVMYFVTRTRNTSSGTFYQRLHGVSITTGTDIAGSPVTISASVSGTGNGSSGGTLSFNPQHENQRPGLALANGNVIISWAGHEDQEPWHGWVISYSETTLAQTGHFCSTPNAYGGGIWDASQAPAVDSNGNVYVMTGNGTYDGTTDQDYGDSIVKLSTSSGLSSEPTDWFTPDGSTNIGTQGADNPTNEDNKDLDLGSAGPMLIPGASQVFGGGKLGILYLVSTTSMGHEVLNNTQIVQDWEAMPEDSCGYHHIHGAPVYFNNSTNGAHIYVWGENNPGEAFAYSGGKFSTSPSSKTTVYAPTSGNCGMPGDILAVSANGETNGILWANCIYTGNADHNPDGQAGILYAYDATNLGTQLWSTQYGHIAKYVVPVIDNGKVYQPTFADGVVRVYGVSSGGGSPITLIANNLTYSASGASTSLQTDTHYNPDTWIELEATGTGQSVTYTTTSIPAGTYQLQMEWKGNNNRGQLSLAVDGGSALSPNPLDQYSSGETYPTTTFTPNLTFSSTGTHTIKLTATGKNASSSGYYLSTYNFILTPE
jgi:hypothetical protein